MIGESVIKGIVTDHRHDPIEGAKVIINSTGLYPGRTMTVVTDAQGRYALHRVSEGTYQIDVLDGARVATKKVTVDGVASVDLDVALAMHKPGNDQTVTIDSLSPKSGAWTSGCINHDIGDFPPHPAPRGL
jgi:hypothetical protein